MKDVTLKFDKDVFNVEKQASSFSAEKAVFNRRIAETNAQAEVLDRFDDFSDLRIDPAVYEKREGSEYGIPRTGAHPSDSVIFPHQREAAKTFLGSLRGFGLLADVVGSGKTFEAGVVLSELAYRGNIRSALVIAPGQVYDSWVEVLEMRFGLGAGEICHAATAEEWARREKERPAGRKRAGTAPEPKYKKRCNVDDLAAATEAKESFTVPKEKVWMATWEDFSSWPERTADVLFDVIVVDEAHHISEERGAGAKALRLLSMMMKVKKRANRSYCLLLSATPHSGNLDSMFRLWYFIRCKGGDPADFEPETDKKAAVHSAEYLREKEYYHDVVCQGATTVAEFIRKVKIRSVTQETSANRRKFDAYLAASAAPPLEKMSEGEKWEYVREFLRANEDIDRAVTKSVSDAYHNGVLRTIMIRQPNRLPKKKNVVNEYFVPTAAIPSSAAIPDLNGRRIEVRLGGNGEGTVEEDGEELTLAAYAARFAGNIHEGKFYADLLMKILNSFGVTDPAEGVSDPTFKKYNSKEYYRELFSDLPAGVRTAFVPYAGDLFAAKLARLKDLLRLHRRDRVIVFFDYDLEKKQRSDERVIEELRADPEFARRLLVGEHAKDLAVQDAFNARENAVLLVRSAAFTEGANLQKSNIIVNFQVPPDPVAMDQRIGRIFRIGQDRDVVVYSLADITDLEGYVLAYFARIGLLDSASGDATILAGSNNERMVTLRCPVCESVRLLSLEDYEEARKKDGGNLYCDNAEVEHPDAIPGKGMRMNEISVYDFRCDTCGSTFTRSVSEEGYFCMSSNNTEKGLMHESYADRMCSTGAHGDRQVYCRKICAIAHCTRFTAGDMKGKCAALRLYGENRNATENDLMFLCEKCEYRAQCGDCHVGTGPEAIARCAEICSDERPQCHPRPHVLRFDDKWEADCPACAEKRRRGRIKPVQTRTFATFIRGAWNFRHDGGRAFCANLKKEADKVGEIKDILKQDEED